MTFPVLVLPVKKMKSKGSLRSSVVCSRWPAIAVTASGSKYLGIRSINNELVALIASLSLSTQQFPAASAVGMIRDGVTVYFIAAREPGVQVENPRQVAAYDYPPLHGPRSPSFSRATVARWNGGAMIFLAGTASVVGHETRHEGDVEAQCDETLRNIESIVGEAAALIGCSASLDSLTIAKAYIRRARDYEKIAPRVCAALPRTQILFMESDICRRNLLLEIEGVATVSQPS